MISIGFGILPVRSGWDGMGWDGMPGSWSHLALPSPPDTRAAPVRGRRGERARVERPDREGLFLLYSPCVAFACVVVDIAEERFIVPGALLLELPRAHSVRDTPTPVHTSVHTRAPQCAVDARNKD